ncbi:hypothetical protein FCU94_00385 [Vibrio sp. JPW-9-11-11]|nr:hypothetical protein [Vibrio sp. JPW-9-11-11]
MSLRTVKQHIKLLEQQGFIELVHRFDKRGRQRSNLYQLHTPAHLHVELGDTHSPKHSDASPSHRAATAPIISQLNTHTEDYRQAAATMRPVDKQVEAFHREGKSHPFSERIQTMNDSHKRKAKVGENDE